MCNSPFLQLLPHTGPTKGGEAEAVASPNISPEWDLLSLPLWSAERPSLRPSFGPSLPSPRSSETLEAPGGLTFLGLSFILGPLANMSKVGSVDHVSESDLAFMFHA